MNQIIELLDQVKLAKWMIAIALQSYSPLPLARCATSEDNDRFRRACFQTKI